MKWIAFPASALVLGACVAGCSPEPECRAIVEQFIGVINGATNALARVQGPNMHSRLLLELRTQQDRFKDVEQQVDVLTPGQRDDLRLAYKCRQGAVLGAHMRLALTVNTAWAQAAPPAWAEYEALRDQADQLLQAEATLFEKVAGTPPDGLAPVGAKSQASQRSAEFARRAYPSSTLDPFQRGLAALRSRDYDGAISFFSEAIRDDPASARAYRQRGCAYAAYGETERALADYTEAIRREPQNAANYVLRGQCHLLRGERDKAIADYTEAARLNPQYVPLLEEIRKAPAGPART